MASGEAKKHFAETGRPVAFVDRFNRTHWVDIFNGNPKIKAAVGPGVDVMRQGGGERPYIKAKTAKQWYWKPYTPIPGEIFFTEAELEFGRRHAGHVVIEPTIKSVGHRNKDWGRQRWSEFVTLTKDLPIVQLGRPNATDVLPGVTYIPTESFRLAAAVLAHSRAIVTHEGGLHHAAAAVGLPAVVIFGGFISPESTGYASHTNLFTGGQACGMRVNCAHCRQSLAMITPAKVELALRGILETVQERRVVAPGT